jgi:hypothetical protein
MSQNNRLSKAEWDRVKKNKRLGSANLDQIGDHLHTGKHVRFDADEDDSDDDDEEPPAAVEVEEKGEGGVGETDANVKKSAGPAPKRKPSRSGFGGNSVALAAFAYGGSVQLCDGGNLCHVFKVALRSML